MDALIDRYTYINLRDKKTRESLVDKQLIKFQHVNHIDSDGEDFGEDDTHGLLYVDFLADMIDLKDPDEIVLTQSYISVHFNSPAFKDHTTFTITTDDDEAGFTRKELAVKCMRYFHMQLYLCQNYNMVKGCFEVDKVSAQVYDRNSELNTRLEAAYRNNPSIEWMEKEQPYNFKLPEPIFRPVLYYDEYTENGLMQLEYDKQKDYWVFICMEYV